MNFIRFPEPEEWPQLLARPIMDLQEIESRVAPILREVRERGDAAVREFTARFDKVETHELLVTEEELRAADTLVSAELKDAIGLAKVNIETFHRPQLIQPEKITTQPGVVCWRKSVGIERVGLYIPGGSAPLFSTVLMLGVPAQLAGCREVILCTPPDRQGKVHPAILYAAVLSGIRKIYKVGGAQAVAAMAYGTASIAKVDKIFGPGNQYVTAAKQLINKEGIAIDMPAGPSEVAVYADDTSNPAFVAADLLSQAEHGPDSQVILVSTSEMAIQRAGDEVLRQLEELPRKEIARRALANSKALLVKDETEAVRLLNAYAAEHLILAVDHAPDLAGQITNAGSVFLGHYTPEAAGDYASGTNHTLPTNGFARAWSGVSVDSFVKKITFQQVSREGIRNIGPAVETMAAAEELQAHKNAVTVRLKTL
jgi:histidinol dehydrogenase